MKKPKERLQPTVRQKHAKPEFRNDENIREIFDKYHPMENGMPHLRVDDEYKRKLESLFKVKIND